MNKIAIILIYATFITSSAIGESFNAISVEFTRNMKSDNTIEKVKGIIYYDTTNTTLEITYPINQWMILEGNQILIYYPDEKKAIEITSQSLGTLPFLQ